MNYCGATLITKFNWHSREAYGAQNFVSVAAYLVACEVSKVYPNTCNDRPTHHESSEFVYCATFSCPAERQPFLVC